jgi:hypothetical protein
VTTIQQINGMMNSQVSGTDRDLNSIFLFHHRLVAAGNEALLYMANGAAWRSSSGTMRDLNAIAFSGNMGGRLEITVRYYIQPT